MKIFQSHSLTDNFLNIYLSFSEDLMAVRRVSSSSKFSTSRGVNGNISTNERWLSSIDRLLKRIIDTEEAFERFTVRESEFWREWQNSITDRSGSRETLTNSSTKH